MKCDSGGFKETITSFNKGIIEKNSKENSLTYTTDEAIEHFGFGKFQIALSFFIGLTWMADAMEMLILSILSPSLVCEWNINHIEQAMITTGVFAGMVFSSTVWGKVCDKFGRRIGLMCISLSTFFMGTASALAPSFYIFVLFRTLMGVCIGGLPQSITYYSEFLPTSYRARCVVMVDAFWALGSVFESGLAVFVMNPLGWRWLLVFSTIPLLLSAISCWFVPESPRFSVTSGKDNEAYRTLQLIAKVNNTTMPKGQFSDKKSKTEELGRFRDLFSSDMAYTTILVMFIWFSVTICYYGIVLYTTVLFQSNNECHGMFVDSQLNATNGMANETSCRMLTHDDYINLVYTSFSEFPGLFITLILIEVVGRKQTMGITFLICAVSTAFLCFCLSRSYVTLLIFIARAFISGAFQAAYVYTPEVYPTSVRAVAIGTASGMGRFGALITPFFAQVAVRLSLLIPAIVYSLFAFLAAISAFLLPIETRGRAMKNRLRDEPI